MSIPTKSAGNETTVPVGSEFSFEKKREKDADMQRLTGELSGIMEILAFLVSLCMGGKNGALSNDSVVRQIALSLGSDPEKFSQSIAEFRAGTKDGGTLIKETLVSIDPAKANLNAARTTFENSTPKGDAYPAFLEHLTLREGYRNKVYLDSRGNPTVGVGHLVRPEDHLKVGDTISDERIAAFLETDAKGAYNAAIEQAKELGISDKNVVIGLASVNYQLGSGWRTEFSNTWAKMKSGDFEGAIRNVESSLWNKQTPVRVDDFQNVLNHAAAIRDGNVQIASLDTHTTQTERQAMFNGGGVKEENPRSIKDGTLKAEFDDGGVDEIAKVAQQDKPAADSLIADASLASMAKPITSSIGAGA